MVYRSSTQVIEILPAPIQQFLEEQGWWAPVASLGVHAIIFALLPFISLPLTLGDEAEIQRRVSVIELDAADLERIPDFSDPEIDIPPIPEGDDFYTFDDYEPPPIDSIPPIDLPPVPSFGNWRDQFRLPPLPLPTSPVEPRPIPNPPLTEPLPPLNEPIESSEETNPPIDEEPPPLTPAEIAQLNQTRQQEWLARNQELQQQFTFNPPSDQGIIDAIGVWQETAEQASINGGEVLEGIKFPYPETACVLGRAENITTTLGVFVGVEGTVLEEPEPQTLITSGFEFFDNKALEAIASYEFEGQSEENQAFIVDVIFEYTAESCSNDPSEEDATDDLPEDDTTDVGQASTLPTS